MVTTRSPKHAVVYGAGAGVVASLAMGMYAMVAAWAKGTGFFTPLHHIASLVAPEDSMMASMHAAAAGNDFHVAFGTAALGAAIHMMTGAMYGAVFGLAVSRMDLARGMLAAAGLVYGALVFVMSAFVGLPLAASVLGAGDPIRNMAELAGWGTFAVEHLVFGLALGLILGVLRQRATSAVEESSHAHAG